MTNLDIALAFSQHRFDDALPHLHERCTWTLVGEAELTGSEAIGAACLRTAGELADVETTWLRLVTAGTDDVVAVDAVGRYAGATGTVAVSSCDVYEFEDDRITAITSYAVELPGPPAAVDGDATDEHPGAPPA